MTWKFATLRWNVLYKILQKCASIMKLIVLFLIYFLISLFIIIVNIVHKFFTQNIYNIQYPLALSLCNNVANFKRTKKRIF